MTKYKEILRLHRQSLSNRSIASLLGCSRNTVAKVLEAFNRSDLAWSQIESYTEVQITKTLFPVEESETHRAMPDFEYIHKELAKPGVNLTLLWDEYCLSARVSTEFLTCIPSSIRCTVTLLFETKLQCTCIINQAKAWRSIGRDRKLISSIAQQVKSSTCMSLLQRFQAASTPTLKDFLK